MALLLKQLDIHGFKSFATPTTFVFDQGITAIIGPNGSGKSNVAEALRWVLGEQGYTSLRSRRTEDVIFAGTDKRAQLSMAEVVLTLDNHDGDLPLPYSEITVTRRAFRSGDSQYLINGGRVRLKDVQQLVAPLGQSYTIIGQGLVDAALSQRPEERRGLFEHAAGISGLRIRATEAERSLAEATANAQRLRDILSELGPRVRSLERSARQAREYGAVRDRLLTLQRRHYGQLWTESLARLVSTRAALHQAEQSHEELERNHERASRHLGGLRSDERRLAEDHRHLTESVAAHERALADARHQLALLEARIRAAVERLADFQNRVDELHREIAASNDEADRHDAESDEIRRSIEAMSTRLAEHDAVAGSVRRRRAELRDLLNTTDKLLVAISRELAETDGTRQSLTERMATLDTDRSQLESLTTRDRERVTSLRDRAQEVGKREQRLLQQIKAVEAVAFESDDAISRAREQVVERRVALQQAESEQASLQARLDVLDRSHASGDGLFAGVRAVLRAVNRRELALPGLIGTLAETIDVPKEFETAIEVALGGHLQDIVVEEWSDAQAAIEFLKASNAGRATFQPLETVRLGRRPSLNVNDSALIGVAADLIVFLERVGPIIEQLLGRTLVVADLDATRRILASAPGWTLVTVSGEITRPSGSVTGGGSSAESGVLGRERERRSLPKTIETLAADRIALQSEIDSAVVEVEMCEANRQAQQVELDERQRAQREMRADNERMLRELNDLESALEDAAERAKALDSREREIRNSTDAVVLRRAALEEEQRTLQASRDGVEYDLAATPSDVDSAGAGLRVELTAMRERLLTEDAITSRARERAAAAQRAAGDRRGEMTRLTEAFATYDADRLGIEAAIADLAKQLIASQTAVSPISSQRDEIAGMLTMAERELNRAAESLRDAERERDRATLNLARVQDEQVFLIERIRGDLELDDPSALESCQPDDSNVMPDEHEINRLRDRLRRMSNVDDDALAQHEAESQRLSYLSGQLADVDQAADGLRRVLAELNGKMANLYNGTFRDVAVAFEQTFSRLFGGGSARLVMDANDDGAAGIEIVAQPPGKRLQTLTALSGGERALTAVALLIAIQRVNPSPFCLLDEVDAALDESNVIRFRDELRDLAVSTQYVVITHNRGTIEGADTLYGVTMGDDGISRILSLRLEEAIHAVEEYATAEAVNG